LLLCESAMLSARHLILPSMSQLHGYDNQPLTFSLCSVRNILNYN
jgi:hypothetical protein